MDATRIIDESRTVPDSAACNLIVVPEHGFLAP
jgi:hypothetical protein